MLRKIFQMHKKVDECCEEMGRFQSDGVIEGFSEQQLGWYWYISIMLAQQL